LYALGVAAFAATFPVIVVNGLAPGTEPMELVLAVVAAAALAAFCWKGLRNATGKYDLVIDEKAGTVTLPQTCGRRQSITLSRAEMAGVFIRRRATRLTSGTYYGYLPVLKRADQGAGPRNETLSPWGWTEEKARGFSEWLGRRLGLDFNGVEDENPETRTLPLET
jgi:hypothetical protein